MQKDSAPWSWLGSTALEQTGQLNQSRDSCGLKGRITLFLRHQFKSPWGLFSLLVGYRAYCPRQ